MKLTNRLLACAELVPVGTVAADVGTDHGYLPVYLLEQGICPRVIASDLRPMPLEAARRSAERAGLTDRISFYLSDGLENLPISEIDTVICAGMGGDCISGILERARETWPRLGHLILQPQSSASDLRKYLGEHGFSIRREKLARDGRFLYAILDVSYGGGTAPTPGRQFLSDALAKSGDRLLPDYYARTLASVEKSIAGLRQAQTPQRELLSYFETARRELMEMGEQYGLGQ